VVISSGVDHEAVSRKNPDWSVYDWCRYFDRDLRKAMKRYGLVGEPDVLMDCGSECRCGNRPSD
jgi:O-glycosyl hydrolase